MLGEEVELARLWLEKARRDIHMAEAGLEREYPDEAGFHVQQAIEKALKAKLIVGGVMPPKIHDLRRLATLLGPAAPSLSSELAQTVTVWAVKGRYAEDEHVGPSLEEVREALEQARGVVAAVTADVG